VALALDHQTLRVGEARCERVPSLLEEHAAAVDTSTGCAISRSVTSRECPS
jgi:hypothetical protein